MRTKAIVLSEEDRAKAAEYLTRYGEHDPATGCINWTGPSQGPREDPQRPLVHLPGRRKWYAYRIAWVLAHGDVPAGLLLCHHCDNGMCINVAHLFVGSHVDNMQDMISKGRQGTFERRRGMDHHAVRHPDELVAEARRLWATGAYRSYADLGCRLGVRRQSIADWVNGRTRTTRPVPVEVGT